ncbi:MAG: hypothetical protein CL609_08815 [Anaerolineaceae bacterium]|nr:hypothetical protein [Anaerolineaceae bacterium]
MSFSIPALTIILIILFPNLLFVFFPPTSKPENIPEENKWTSMLEHGGQILFFATFIFLPHQPRQDGNPMLFIWLIVCTAIYYALWIRYMVKKQAYRALFENFLGIPIPMAIFPILAFTFGVLWLQVWLTLIPLYLFAIGHFISSWNSAQYLYS